MPLVAWTAEVHEVDRTFEIDRARLHLNLQSAPLSSKQQALMLATHRAREYLGRIAKLA